MKDVLVVYATKMGSTEEIAQAIAGELARAGLSSEVYPASRAPGPGGYRAVVLGSAIYLRRWRRDALRYLRRHRTILKGMPVWLFQSGPCGQAASEAATAPVPLAARRLALGIGAQLPVTFGGRLDRAHAVGLVARWVVSSAELRGDHRDWASIRAWAADIAAALAADAASPGSFETPRERAQREEPGRDRAGRGRR